jgi:hypothetical protein
MAVKEMQNRTTTWTFDLHLENQLVCSTLNEKYIPYSLIIPYWLFLISFDGFQLNLENTSTTENASGLLIFKFRGL